MIPVAGPGHWNDPDQVHWQGKQSYCKTARIFAKVKNARELSKGKVWIEGENGGYRSFRYKIISIRSPFDTSLLSRVVNSSTYLTWVRLETTSIETIGFQNGEWDWRETQKIYFLSLSLSPSLSLPLSPSPQTQKKNTHTQEKPPTVLQSKLKNSDKITISWRRRDVPGAPNVNFRKISVRKTIWDLQFSEHLL